MVKEYLKSNNPNMETMRRNEILMKKLLLILLLSLMSSIAAASEWFLVGSSNDAEVYFVDVSTIKPMKNGITSGWIRVDLLKPKWQGLFKENAKRYMDNIVFDCNNEKFATTDRVIYGGSGKNLDSQHWQASFISPAPGSMAVNIAKFTCGKAASLVKGESISGIAESSLGQTSWKSINQDDISTTFLGLTNYEWVSEKEVPEGMVYFLARSDYKQPRAIGNDFYQMYIVQWAAMCTTQNMFITQDIYYAANGQVVARGEYDLKNEKVMKASPDTIGMSFLNIACSEFKRPINETKKVINPQNPATKAPTYFSGTAWQVSNNQLVTAYHVVNGAKSMFISLANGETKAAKVIASDPSNDLAVIQIIDGTLVTKPLQLANKPSLLGTKIAVIGYPLPDILGTKVQATSGEISKLAGIQDDLRFYQISAAVQQGNSGGPLLNQQGEVIGVVSSKLNAINILKEHGDLPQNVNFAVKYPYISAMLDAANVLPTKSQKKTNKIEDAITQAKESVYLLIVVGDVP